MKYYCNCSNKIIYKIIITLIIIKIIMINLINTKDFYGYDSDYYYQHGNGNGLDLENPKLIQQPAGSDIRLKCGIRGNHADFMSTSDVYWDFRACGEGYNQTSCRKQNNEMDNLPWKKIDCNEKPCKATLLISNPSENDSGLYRCSIQPYKPNNHITLQIQVVRTYQLDVINFTVAEPELLDDSPRNTTALLDSQVVLQCRVFSKVPPSIKWFRKQDQSSTLNNNYQSDNIAASSSSSSRLEDENDNNTRAIHYLENKYELLDSAGEKVLSEDTYLSKLILNNVSERDAGIYACVGINYRGFKIREAYLNVLIPDELDIYNKTNKKDLLLLFLIPIGLALIPLSIWTCYIIIKKRNKKILINNDNRKYIQINVIRN